MTAVRAFPPDEFPVTRPTPTRAENDLTATTGDVVMIKQWDLSPIDQSSFYPFEPPGRPLDPSIPPPVNTTAPTIAAFDGLAVGDLLAGQVGVWSGSPTFTRQWLRGATPIPGETAPGYTLATEDIGADIGLEVTATNAGGSSSAEAEPVGPVAPAP